MVTLNAHYDGKAIVPDEPLALAPNQKVRVSVEPLATTVFTPQADPTTALVTGGPLDERAALHIDPLDAVPADFVRRPGSGAGEITMSDDFDDTPADFEEYR